MSCPQYKDLISGYLDGELSPDQRQRLENHLQTCPVCAEELRQFTAMKEELAMFKFKEPSDAELQRYWSGVYNRLERGIGWILFSVGAIVALSYGGFKLVEEMIADPDIALVLKIGVVALIFGTVILFVSLLRERLSLRKSDKYSREVER
jgi:hypothetical protein